MACEDHLQPFFTATRIIKFFKFHYIKFGMKMTDNTVEKGTGNTKSTFLLCGRAPFV